MKILIADDHALIVEDLIDEVKRLIPDAECIGTSNPREITELFAAHQFDVVLMDIDMPGENGISITTRLLAMKPRTNIIYITGYEEFALESYSTYASAFLVKPISREKLRDAMEHLRYPVSRITDEMIELAHAGKGALGKHIQKYREEAGLSRQALAEEMGVSVPTVHRWESGERTPDIPTLMKLAQIFGVGVEQLIQ